MSSVPRLEFIEREEWIVDIYDLEVEWDEAARADFAADPAAFLRRQIEWAYRHPTEGESSSEPGRPIKPVPVNQILIGEELLDPTGPKMRCHHIKAPPSQYSHHEVVGRLGGDRLTSSD
jgi:hypothetical protein